MPVTARSPPSVRTEPGGPAGDPLSRRLGGPTTARSCGCWRPVLGWSAHPAGERLSCSNQRVRPIDAVESGRGEPGLRRIAHVDHRNGALRMGARALSPWTEDQARYQPAALTDAGQAGSSTLGSRHAGLVAARCRRRRSAASDARRWRSAVSSMARIGRHLTSRRSPNSELEFHGRPNWQNRSKAPSASAIIGRRRPCDQAGRRQRRGIEVMSGASTRGQSSRAREPDGWPAPTGRPRPPR
jgi:hypothetical protein